MKSWSHLKYSARRKTIKSVVLVTLDQHCPCILQTVLISFLNSMEISYKPNRNSIPHFHLGKCYLCLKAEKEKAHATLFVKVNIVQQSSASNKGVSGQDQHVAAITANTYQMPSGMENVIHDRSLETNREE